MYVFMRVCVCVRKNKCHGLDDYETRSHRILGGIFNLLLGGDGVKQTFIKNEDGEQRQSLSAPPLYAGDVFASHPFFSASTP